MNYYAHPTAIIDDGALIGEGTKIWHFCHVMPTAHIGKHSTLGQNVFVADEVEIGNHVKIQNNVSVYKGVVLEDDVFVGPSAVFTNVLYPRSRIDRKSEYSQTVVKKGATIGANATILCGITIGRYAMIGAGSVVLTDVPDFAICVGNPARQSGWISEMGHPLIFGENHQCKCPLSGDSYFINDQGVVGKVIK